MAKIIEKAWRLAYQGGEAEMAAKTGMSLFASYRTGTDSVGYAIIGVIWFRSVGVWHQQQPASMQHGRQENISGGVTKRIAAAAAISGSSRHHRQMSSGGAIGIKTARNGKCLRNGVARNDVISAASVAATDISA